MTNNTEPKTDFANGDMIINYLKIILHYKKLIIAVTLIVGIIVTLLMFFIIKPVYYSSAIVKSSDKGMGLSGLIGSSIPDLGGLEELSGGSGSSKELALYEEILGSRKCLEETIIKFGLMETYDIKYMQDAVKFFREELLELSTNKKAGTLNIGAYDESPERVKEIVNYLILQLNNIYVDVRVKNAKINREFIEDRYNLVRSDLVRIEDSLRMFQEKFGIAPDVQVQAAAKTEIELEVEIKSDEIKLELLRKILSPDQSEIKSLEDKLNALKTQLNEIKTSPFSENKLNLKGGPEILMNYLRIRRDVEIQNKILTTLIPLFEQSKIEEKRETPSVIILDEPKVPEKKKKPKRIISILASMFVTFVFLSVSTVVYESFYKQLSFKLRNNV